MVELHSNSDVDAQFISSLINTGFNWVMGMLNGVVLDFIGFDLGLGGTTETAEATLAQSGFLTGVVDEIITWARGLANEYLADIMPGLAIVQTTDNGKPTYHVQGQTEDMSDA